MDRDGTLVGLIIGLILGIILGIYASRIIHGPRMYINKEEWEMKEMPDGTLKLIVHRRATENE